MDDAGNQGRVFLVVLPPVDGVPIVSLRIADEPQVYAWSNKRVNDVGMGGEQRDCCSTQPLSQSLANGCRGGRRAEVEGAEWCCASVRCTSGRPV